MDFSKIFINNKWVNPVSKRVIEVANPYTQKVFNRVPACNALDVDRAVRSAHDAQGGWAKTTLAERIAIMEKFLEVFRSQEDVLVDTIVQELGCPVSFTRASQVRYQYERVRSYIDLAPAVPMVEKMKASTVYRDPVGVVACLTPWNYPLGQIIQKVVPAILMGNAVVLKPSQHTPLSAYYLAEAFLQAGLPAGVFNLVPGRAAEVGDVLSSHPMVDMVSFTGSTVGGIKVGQSALHDVKRISLELGGKSPYIILPGVKDYTKPIHICFDSIFMNSGQTCTAFSRLLIPFEDKEKIEKELVRIAGEYKLGDPRDTATKLGPLASAQQYHKVCSYIGTGIGEGAKLLCGGLQGAEDQSYLVPPTIFTDVDNRKMSIAHDEIFGPVLCVLTYKSVDEAVEIANDTRYGLNAGVYGDSELALKVAHGIWAGNVYINDSPRDTAAPFGGYKHSGFGREGGKYGMMEFTQQKAFFDSKI